MNRRSLWIFILIAIVLGITLWSVGGDRALSMAPYYWHRLRDETGVVQIGDDRVLVEIARTSQTQQTGLSHRNYLPYEKGMLFTFTVAGQYIFTMRDTKIPLDIIWINEGAIVHIEHRAQPGVELINPQVIATDVLEITSGGAAARGWKIGDTVSITFDRD
ncbi:MAG: DUF192 domain-containing protein [Candidatus Kerfeldbacteria bacterium]|nr:DUF192 domain-containing protein [Candidatus Kerfeldbacteria bacterium]